MGLWRKVREQGGKVFRFAEADLASSGGSSFPLDYDDGTNTYLAHGGSIAGVLTLSNILDGESTEATLLSYVASGQSQSIFNSYNGLTGANSHVQWEAVGNDADANISATGKTTSTTASVEVFSGNGATNNHCAIRSSKLGVFAATPVVKQTVTGSRGGNAALASLLTALATYGLITDSTTA